MSLATAYSLEKVSPITVIRWKKCADCLIIRLKKCTDYLIIRLKKCVDSSIIHIYHINNAIKLGQYNVGREGEVLTIPLYMGFLVKDKLTEIIVPDIDLSLLN